MISGLFIYFIKRPAAYFPCLLFQTRYGTDGFARQSREEGPVNFFHREPRFSRAAGRRTAKGVSLGYGPRPAWNGQREAPFTRLFFAGSKFSEAIFQWDWTDGTGRGEKRNRSVIGTEVALRTP